MHLYDSGNRQKAQNAETNLNSNSSGSHSVFSVKIQSLSSENHIGYLNFVDLAGSESLKQQTGQFREEKLIETKMINLSNDALKNILTSLAENCAKKPLYNDRESRLTQLLENALGDNGKTLFITNISPSSNLFSETFNSLKYAVKAHKVQENTNFYIQPLKDYETIITEKINEIQTLKRTNEVLKIELNKKLNQKIKEEDGVFYLAESDDETEKNQDLLKNNKGKKQLFSRANSDYSISKICLIL